MFNIKDLKLSGYFKEKTLERWELLFDEWEIDNNLYYVVSWKMAIEKYTTSEKENTKELAIIKSATFLWEWSLSESNPKEVRCFVLEKTTVLYINAVKDFWDFMKNDVELAKDILVNIISLTNKRTLDSNKYITSLYEINRSIKNISQINFLEIFKILEKIKNILNWEYLLYLEVNPIYKKYLTLKYDSRKHLKMQDILVEKWHYKLEEIWINKKDKIITKEISIWDEVLWNIIVWRKQDFNQNEKRIFLAMVNSLSWILKQKKVLEEERDRNFNN